MFAVWLPYRARLTNLHNEVEKWISDLQKLVRHTVGYDDDVALGNLPCLTTIDSAASQFIWFSGLGVNGFSARDECGAALQHVNDVCVFRMDFCLTRSLPPASVDHVVAAVASIEQNSAPGESLVDFAFLPEGHSRSWVSAHCVGLERLGTGNSQLLILIRSGCSAHAHSAYNLTVDNDGDATDQGREVFEGRHHGAALAAGIDQFFKKARRLLEHDGSSCFADGDVGACGESSVQPFQRHQVAAVVHNCDDSARRL